MATCFQTENKVVFAPTQFLISTRKVSKENQIAIRRLFISGYFPSLSLSSFVVCRFELWPSLVQTVESVDNEKCYAFNRNSKITLFYCIPGDILASTTILLLSSANNRGRKIEFIPETINSPQFTRCQNRKNSMDNDYTFCCFAVCLFVSAWNRRNKSELRRDERSQNFRGGWSDKIQSRDKANLTSLKRVELVRLHWTPSHNYERRVKRCASSSPLLIDFSLPLFRWQCCDAFDQNMHN